MAAVAGSFVMTVPSTPDPLGAASEYRLHESYTPLSLWLLVHFSGLARHSTCLARTHRTCAGGVAWLHISASIPKF